MESFPLQKEMVELIKEAGFKSQLRKYSTGLLKNEQQILFLAKNFGALHDIELLLNRKSIVIGKNNAGKSTIAKLLTISLDLEFYNKKPTIDDFIKQLDLFEVNYLQDDTAIFIASKYGMYIFFKGVFLSYGKDILDQTDLDVKTQEIIKIYRQIKNLFPNNIRNQTDLLEKLMLQAGLDKDAINSLDAIIKLDDIFDMAKAIYIPAERGIISLLSQSLYSLLSKNITLPSFIKNFGAQFESSRKEVKKLEVTSITGVKYAYEDSQDKVYFNEQSHTLLSQAASGIRCLVPLCLVIAAQMKKPVAAFIIEEPEINLHPTAQKGLVNFIAEATVGESKSFITTTHSPYILSAFNNLIVAGTLAEENPALAQEIAAIIPQESWIKYDDVSAYVLENGTARSILDPEWKAIVADEIDSASEEIGREYDQLLALKYRDTPADE